MPGQDESEHEHDTGPEPERQQLVTVTNATGRAISLHAHMKVDDDGAGRAFLGRLRDDKLELQPGVNRGIDKKWFDEWAKQNPGFGLKHLITAEDEPESAQRKE